MEPDLSPRAPESSLDSEYQDAVESLPVLRVTEQGRIFRDEPVVREFPLTIYLNGEELVTLLCTPIKLDYLAAGFLNSEGLVRDHEAIKRLVVDEKKGTVWVETKDPPSLGTDMVFKRLIPSGCGRGAVFYHPSDAASIPKVESVLKVSAPEILSLAQRFQHQSLLYRTTGGVHSAALCSAKDIIAFSEDIARHNAMDRVFGQCLLEGIATDDRIIVTSGRISSEILLKAARRSIPIVVSKSAPTALAIRIANQVGITVVGYVRGKRMNVYTNEWRLLP